MNWGGPEFVLWIIGMSMLAWVITTWLRAKHGYPVEDELGNLVHPRRPEDERQIAQLTGENQGLKHQVDRLEQRLQVLERIATDPAERTAREIESLR